MTADVNFGLLRRLVDGVEGARPHGPVGQGQFLREMGIGARLTALAEQPHVTEEQVSLGALWVCRLFGGSCVLSRPSFGWGGRGRSGVWLDVGFRTLASTTFGVGVERVLLNFGGTVVFVWHPTTEVPTEVPTGRARSVVLDWMWI